MDTKIVLEALYNTIMDGDSGCMLDTLSVKIDSPVFDPAVGEFTQHVLFSLDRISSPSEIGFLHRLEEEYNRLKGGIDFV